MSNDKENPNEEQQFLTFILDHEEYGIDIMKVMEIRGWEKPTIIPQSPFFVKGVINIRGTIVPIIDLRKKFELQEKDYSKLTVVIVVQVATKKGERVMGIIVDAVSEVYNFNLSSLKPAPEIMSEKKSKYINGLVSKDEKMIIILDVEKLLDEESTEAVFNNLDLAS